MFLKKLLLLLTASFVITLLHAIDVDLDFEANKTQICEEGAVSLINKTPNKESYYSKYEFYWILPNGQEDPQNEAFATSFSPANIGDGKAKLQLRDKETKEVVKEIEKDLGISFYTKPPVTITSDLERNGKISICRGTNFQLEALIGDSTRKIVQSVWQVGLTPEKIGNPVGYNSDDIGSTDNAKITFDIVDGNGCMYTYVRKDNYLQVHDAKAKIPDLEVKVNNGEWKGVYVSNCLDTFSFSARSEMLSTNEIDSYMWTLPDGTENSTNTEVSGVIEGFGSRKVMLDIVDENGCTSSKSISFLSRDFVSTLGFTVKDTAGNSVDLSVGNCAMEYRFVPRLSIWDSVAWDLDNDGIFTSENAHTFGGPATVSMYAEDAGEGCKGSITEDLIIEPVASVSVSVDKQYTCKSGDPFVFDITSNLDTIYSKFFLASDSSEFYASHLEHLFGSGTDTITVSFETPIGCPVNDTTFVVEVAEPAVKWNVLQRQSHCIPHTVRITDGSEYAPETFEDSIVRYTCDWDYNRNVDFYESTTPPVIGSEAKHQFDTAGTYIVHYSVETALGCVAFRDTIVSVGDSCEIHYGLIDTLVCGSGDAVEYVDSSENRHWVDYVSVTAKSSTNRLRSAAGRELVGNPVYGQSSFIAGFDTVGAYDLYVLLEYKECKVYGHYPNKIFVKGPIVKGQVEKDSSYRWSDIDISLASAYDADDTIHWEILKKEGTDERPVYVHIADSSLHKDSTLRFVAADPGKYVAVAGATCTESSCSYVDTVPFNIYKIDITYINSIQPAMCLEDSIFLFKRYELFASNGIEDITSLEFTATAPSGEVTGPMSISIDRGEIAMDTLWIKENGAYTFGFTANDPYNLKKTVQGSFTVYKVEANAMTLDTTGCLPVAVEYTNTSTADTAFQRFEWTTNGNQTGTTSSIGETFKTVYNTTEPIELMLIAHTVPVNSFSSGCVDTVIVKGSVKPIIPPLDFSVTDKICLQTPASIERNVALAADSVFWKFDGGEWEEETMPAFTRQYDTSGDYKIAMKIGVDSLGYFCYNEIEKDVSVREYYAKLNLLSPKSQCFTIGNWEFETDSVWSDVGYNWTVDAESYGNLNLPKYSRSFKDSPGTHKIVLEIVTNNYAGCGVLRDSITVDALGANVDFEIADIDGNKLDTICVDTKFSVKFKDTMNLSLTGFEWILGDGGYDSTQTAFDHSYKTVPNSGMYYIEVFQKEACSGYIIDENNNILGELKPSKRDSVFMYRLESRFLLNGYEDHIASCPPLDAVFTNQSIGFDDVVWDFGNGQTSTEPYPGNLVYDKEGVYTVSLFVKDAQCQHSLSRNIQIFPEPSATFEAKYDHGIGCEGIDVPIVGTANGNYSYQWSPSEYLSTDSDLNTLYANPDSSRSFYVTATNQYNCHIEDSVHIAVQNRPVYTGAPYDTIKHYKGNNYVNFRPTDTLIVLENYLLGNDAQENILYKWTPSDYLSCDTCANPSISISGDVEHVDYEVRMTDKYGCFDVVENISFSVIKNTMFDIPMAFSPNGDGENDKLYVRGWAIRDLLEFRVYNRWGQLVFETSDLANGWDGTFNGKPQPIDTYAYILKVVNFEGETEVKQGDFNLLR